MTVSRVMTHNPFTISDDTAVADAMALIHKEKVHRLPVLDKERKLVGIVSEKDLLYASPSPASTLSVYEMSALLARLKVKKVMTKEVITVTEQTLIEDAARIMVDKNVGGLPVMRDGLLVGIITESDIFKLFSELFGTRKRGLRVTALVPEQRGEIAGMAAAISEKGGNIISFGTFLGEDVSNSLCTFKVDEIGKEELQKAIAPYVVRIIDLREV
ncbi:CBS domain-containing protein [Sediminispirochaeta smaragdinae]|jgi:acetoin utilization protein AcuB|uniref:Signal transduction protein with CBS domains n=1 Tax=Sediminispirochaeta smaragdinae (strain DSM 11293 / JCM 15392 / SEBR 4228) TaxID=573413 RepID=E1RAX4_SEDSS|nr:CBS domain-containing protein [Sediminispirochaeta smaragdinae]ADK79504.1 putative signal transduction protein with CBS domains [Sediminispirochaeta smaragdinae DSM 11293]